MAKSEYNTPYLKQVIERAGGQVEVTQNDEISTKAVRYVLNELRKMKETSHFPDELWFHAALYAVDCHNHQFDGQLRRTPAQKFLGDEAAKCLEGLIVVR